MPEVLTDGVRMTRTHGRSNFKESMSSRRSTITQSFKSGPSEYLEFSLARDEPSIEQLYDNIYAMESSSTESTSRYSNSSEGEESRIDSELCHLVGGGRRVKAAEEEEDKNVTLIVSRGESRTTKQTGENLTKTHHRSVSSVSSKKLKRPPQLLKSVSSSRSVSDLNSRGGRMKNLDKAPTGEANPDNKGGDLAKAGLENPDLGPFFLKHARELIASNNAQRALKYALRAVKSFEKCAGGNPSLGLAMSLHVVAAIHCQLGEYAEAVPFLQRSIKTLVPEKNHQHDLAKFSGCMQLGDTYAMLGQIESSIRCYEEGLEIQRRTLGDMDPRVGETCRYLAEAHVQALQFDEAEKLCKKALDIHRQKGKTASLEEVADRRLMGLICDVKGNHEVALEHLFLASIALVANGHETEVAPVDLGIGDIYLSLARYDEAVFAYQKALTVFKTCKGENHPMVASVFVRLADLYNKIGKFKESQSYCENALRIFDNANLDTSSEEVATGLTSISSIYESMNEHEEALKLLQRALKMYSNYPCQQSTIAGIEAQMGVLHYILEDYEQSYLCFSNAITKLRACGEKKSPFFAIALNQMGLACVQKFDITEAAELFMEAKRILEQEYGPIHPDTLGVYSNLAGAYDALGRFDDAIEILEHVVGLREEKLGTASSDVDDEKKRLSELLKETGRVRRESKSLETLFDKSSHPTKRNIALQLERLVHL